MRLVAISRLAGLWVLVALWAAAAPAAADWRELGVSVRQGGPPLPAPPPVALPAEALADSRPAIGDSGIVKALLIEPTDRYRHGVLGDAIEAGALRVITEGGLMLEERLPPDAVFEDLRPRLVDLTGDGGDEVLTIKAYRDRGAALALYGLLGGELALLDETPAIGTPNRWRNPAGTGDFDGDGRTELVEVTTPHIGGTLRLWRWRDGRLSAGPTFAGVSNHAIGSRALDLSAVLDLDGDGDEELVIPAMGRRELLALDLRDESWRIVARLRHASPIVSDFVASDMDGNGRTDIGYRLDDGTTVRLMR
jgi:hypothetical protein